MIGEWGAWVEGQGGGVGTGYVKSSVERVGMGRLDICVVLDSVCVCVCGWERGGERE